MAFSLAGPHGQPRVASEPTGETGVLKPGPTGATAREIE